ncbi:MAG: hypothetical protein DRJ42_15980 [Deltaproteobacteria bacterium]|nr:MAG: hypothetical protein DRJ42_15980 [Deltaproteobacteria bacterium]
MRISLIVCLAALTIGGCGDPEVVAGLELRIDLPAAASDAAEAFVQIRRESGAPFDSGFEEETLASVPLAGMRSEDAISVVTDDATAAIKVRIRFCSAANCVGEADAPAQRFILRAPFHTDERSLYRIFAEDPAIDVPVPVEVDGCQVRACSESDLSTYCNSDGVHLCDLPHAPGPTPDPISVRVVQI